MANSLAVLRPGRRSHVFHRTDWLRSVVIISWVSIFREGFSNPETQGRVSVILHLWLDQFERAVSEFCVPDRKPSRADASGEPRQGY